MSRKILILGGVRFHGYQLAEFLLNSGNEVYVLNRGNYRTLADSDLKQLTADRNNISAMKEALDDKCFDVVIDNNAYNPHQINTALGLLRERCAHYIFTSTVAVYMTLSSDRRLKESDATGNSDGPYPPAVKEYALNKLAAENALANSADGLNYTILRFPNIYGEGDFAGKLSYFYHRLKNGGRILVEDEVRKFSIIYVKDVVRAFAAVILNKGCYGRTMNIADPAEYDLDGFFSRVYGDLYSPDRLFAISAKEIWEKGYSCSSPWSVVMDTSLSERLTGHLRFTSPDVWSKDAIAWELEHLGDRALDADFARQREAELRLIREYGG